MQDRLAAPALIAALAGERHRTSFFQMVQLLLRGLPGAEAPGGAGPTSREALRFRSSTGLGFAAADVEEIEALENPGGELSHLVRLTVNFMGIYGPASPMPSHVTEELLWAGREGEALRDFLDLFNHRLISFVYRAWEKYRHHVQFSPDGPDRFTRRALCFTGLGTAGALPALGGPYLPLLRVAGLLNQKPHSAVGLEGLLQDHFPGIEIEVEPMVPVEVRIPADQVARLGVSGRLGENLCLGESLRDRGGNFRVSLGPLPRERYRELLPRGETFRRLVRTIRFYVSDPFTFSVRLRLAEGEVPPLRLSEEGRLPLGQMSWLGADEHLAGETVLSTAREDPLRSGAGRASGKAATQQ